MSQNPFYRKKPVRQEWVPEWWLQIPHKAWLILYTAAKVAAGAAVTVALIGIVCCFALLGGEPCTCACLNFVFFLFAR